MDGIRVSAQLLNHPAIALGYKIEADGVSLLYLCDHEPYWESLWRSDAEPGKLDSILHEGDRRHAAFMQGADVVIHDAQYTPEEYPAWKNWGHSTYSYVAKIASAAGVKRVFLSHHDPDARRRLSRPHRSRTRRKSGCIAGFARRNSLRPRGLLRPPSKGSKRLTTLTVALAESDHSGSLLILVVDDDEDLRLLARQALVRRSQRNRGVQRRRGPEVIRDQPPDLLVLDFQMTGIDGFEVLRKLRATEAGRPFP